MSDLFDLLAQQTEQLNELSCLLSEELEAFEKRDVDTIINLAQSKTEKLTAVANLDEQIAAHPELAQQKQNESFKEQVAKTETLLETVKDKNTVNLQVANRSMNGIKQLKQSILSLKDNNAMTYDKKGYANTQTMGGGIKA